MLKGIRQLGPCEYVEWHGGADWEERVQCGNVGVKIVVKEALGDNLIAITRCLEHSDLVEWEEGMEREEEDI